jgi:RNA polymerase sigma-70 factor (ECF subfamily)
MSDADLVRAIQAGDETALETLYQQYLPSVWRYAFAQLSGNGPSAEDVVSETFLAAVRQIGRLAPEGGSVAGWLIGIARHKVQDLRRRSARLSAALSEKITAAPAAPADDPSAPLETAELRQRVGAIMDGLEDDERAVLEWKYLDGLSVREIADRLGRTEKAVEAALYRARQSFRAAYEQAERAPR